MIRAFKCKHTEARFSRKFVKKISAIERAARRKLAIIDGGDTLNDLRVPPANRLEALKGDRKGRYSIRINDQFRICFRWKADGVHDVEIVDYH